MASDPVGHEVFPPETVAALRAAGSPPLPGGRRALDPRTGAVLVPCVACGAPAHEAHAPRIRVGTIRRYRNGNLGGLPPGTIPKATGHGARHWSGPSDTRTHVWIPRVRVGAGCPACAAAFTAVKLAHAGAREPFLRWPRPVDGADPV